MTRNDRIKVIAHRGSATDRIKENTVEAFRRAVQAGADMIETDIRMTKDNQLVCAHYPTWNGRFIRDFTYEEWRAETEQRENWTPALLTDLLPLVEEGTSFNLEVKEKGLEQKVLQQIPASDHILFSSFDEKIIKNMKKVDPVCRTALLTGEFSFLQKRKKPFQWWRDYFPEKRLQETGADIVCPHYRLAGARFIQRMHKKGYKVYVWTVNKPKYWEKLKTYGADAVFTDDVAAGRRFVS
ncbi:glycerophosphodiester phosphodiesterase [Salibacterium sp. K-3]